MDRGPVVVRDQLFTASSADAYRQSIDTSVDVLLNYLAKADRPFSGAVPAEVAPRIDAVDLDAPLDGLSSALAEVESTLLDDAVWFHHPRYLAHLNCPVLIPALAGDALASAINTSMDTWDQSAGGTLMERRLVQWTAGRIGFGAHADGVFTSGGTQSNLQAMVMARGQAFLDAGGNLSRSMADIAPRLRIMTSQDGHFSVQKAAAILGLGTDAVITIPTDKHHRMDASALEYELDQVRRYGLVPMAVIATAGTTDFGAIDPISAIADLCDHHEVWLHVDAAFGGGLLVSRQRRDLLDGIERADSVTVDFHKSWFQPVSASVVMVSDGSAMRHVTYHADYLNPRSEEFPNQVDKSMQTTRRFDALKMWMTLRVMGPDAIGSMFDEVIDLASDGYRLMAEHPDIDIEVEPVLSTLVFRYRPAELDEDHADLINPEIRRRLMRSGAAVIAGTRVADRAWLKFTLLNPHTTHEDLAAVVDLICEHGRAVRAEVHSGQAMR